MIQFVFSFFRWVFGSSCSVAFLIVLGVNIAVSSSKVIPSYYHTTDEILRLVRSQRFTETGGIVKERFGIPYIVYGNADLSNTNAPLDLWVFSEHARELISAEVALHLIRSGKPKSNVIIVPLLNIEGRRRVEQGEHCFRTNGNGVDLNRNYPLVTSSSSLRRRRNDPHSPTNPGPHPFSEKETRFIHYLMTHYTIHTYITIHSGEWAIYSPWDSKTGDPLYRKKTRISNVLGFCPLCVSGPAALVSSYLAYGTAVDYYYSRGLAREAYTFEIFGTSHPSRTCLGRFNPLDSVSFHRVLQQWSTILLRF